MPPVGKSGPGTMSIRSSIDRPGSSISATQASTTSPRLCGGMLVAMPTAMPPAPLTRRFGKRAGRTTGSLLVAVVVLLEIDRVLVDVLEQRHRRLGQAAFGVAHRRRRIVVDRAEIALPVDQRQAHREVLRHAHQRVVDRLVAVRVIFADHVADDARRLHVLLVGRVPLLVHRIEDAAVHRLEAVARVRERTRHDHAHRVIEIRALHLVRDRHGPDIRGRRRLAGLVVFVVGQGGFRDAIQCAIHIGDLRRAEPPQSDVFSAIISLVIFNSLRGACKVAGRVAATPAACYVMASGCLSARAPSGMTLAPRFSGLGAGHAVRRGRPDRPDAGVPRRHRRPAAAGAASASRCAPA